MENMVLFNENQKYVSFIRSTLLEEFSTQYRNGLYAYTQKSLTYNSNHMEGSALTEEQTSSLFDTGTVYGEDVFRAQDIEEANGHFWMFNEMLKSLDSELTEELIKHFHYCLKNNVFIYRANGYIAGEYKKRPNIAGTEKTVSPAAVPEAIQSLLMVYNKKKKKSLLDIVKFHADFEHIHPFQDGNGRVGRLILFREALINDFVPPIIADKDHTKYIYAIREAHQENYERLLDIVQEAQAFYLNEVKYFMGL